MYRFAEMSELDFEHIYLPAPAEATSPRVLLLLHGTGGDEHSMVSLGREIDPAAALLSPRGKISENGHLRFFRRLAEGVFDEADVIRRAHELADFVLAAAAHYQFSPERMTAVGYSNGANIAGAVLLLRPEIFAQAILLRAMVSISNAQAPDLSGHRVLISAGEDDPIAPAEGSRELMELFRRGGAEVTLEMQPGGHHLLRGDVIAARRWLQGGEVQPA